MLMSLKVHPTERNFCISLSKLLLSQGETDLSYLRGDTVIMNNCPFHYGRFTEVVLRNLLAEYGASLLFQPAYSPHLSQVSFVSTRSKPSSIPIRC